VQELRKLFSSSKLNILTKLSCWACSSFHTYMKLSDTYSWLVTHARSVHTSISEVQLISKSLFWCKYYLKTFSFHMDLICQFWRLLIILLMILNLENPSLIIPHVWVWARDHHYFRPSSKVWWCQPALPGEFINMYSPVNHISVHLGETKGFTSRHNCGTLDWF